MLCTGGVSYAFSISLLNCLYFQGPHHPMALLMDLPPSKGGWAVPSLGGGGGSKRYEVNILRTSPPTRWGQIHYSGHWKGWALKILPFRGPKSISFRGPPLPMALVMDLSPSKSLRPAPYKQLVPVLLVHSVNGTATKRSIT
jgi:hypothetical protein